MKWVTFIIFFLLCLSFFPPSLAQCGSVDFTLPPQVCLNQSILVQPDAPSETVEWDFCTDDFNSTPTAVSAFQIPGAVGRPAIDLVRENDIWFGFVTGTWTNTLEVLEFGNGVNQPPSQITSFGNLGGKLNNPGSIRVIREQGQWYGIIHNTGSADILKVTFANQFTEVSGVTVLTSGVGYINSGLAIGKDPVEGWIGIISESDNTFTIIRFGNDLHPTTLQADIIETPAVPNPNNLGDIDLINVCGEWFGAAVNLGGGNTYLLSFGSNLFSVPQIDQIASLSVLNAGRLRFANEGNDFFLFIASLDGLWHELKFGETIHTNPIVENQNDLNGTLVPETYALALAKENSEWTIFCVTQDNGQVYRVGYQQSCSAVPATSKERAPVFEFTSAGTYTISMNVISGGQVTRKSKSITVLPQAAPDIDFLTQNVCVGHDVLFTSSNLSGDIDAYQWDFGDVSTSSVANPAHQYGAQGLYSVTLEVSSVNGCINNAFRNISIFPEPVADFTGKSGLLCTYNKLVFTNNTNDIYNGNLSYQWFVDNAAVSTDRDLQYAFTSTGAKDIRLITAIPGCSSEITKTTSPVEEGPVVNFSFTGICEDETFSFQNEITDPVESYLWDFGNSQTSTAQNPDQVFATYGEYAVSLTAANAIGCQNVTTKTVTVHAKPLIDFLTAGPPNACSGTPTQFQDNTTSPDGDDITAWLWEYDDAKNTDPGTVQNPEHIFSDAGLYNVSLTSTTASGCQETSVKEITINQSPSTAFTHTTACDDVPVQFSSPMDNSIVYSYWEIGTAYYNTASPTHTFKSPGAYPLYLEVTAANDCTSKVYQVINVPVPLSVDFSYLKNCVDQQAVLTDITGGDDPVVSRDWVFNSGETFSGSPLAFTFTEQGKKTITLKVTAGSGCEYATSKEIDILPRPEAAFSAEPASGAYPLEVRFTNTSSETTQYLWKFNDGTGTTSTEVSPVYTFNEPGSYDVELIAFNEQACEASFTGPVTTVAPLPDADIEMIALAPNQDGTLKLIVTIHNKGNTILRDQPLNIDFDGVVKLRQIIQEPILPASKYNFVFNTGIMNAESMHYLCVSIDVENDLSTDSNRMCKDLQDTLVVFPAYPNPTPGALTVEWISEAEKNVGISLTDALGRTIIQVDVMGSPGLNQRFMDLSGLQTGIYYLLIEDGAVKKSQRIAVSGKP